MKIFFVNGLRGGEELEFAAPEITVGREEDNSLQLPVGGVSRYHAKIWKKEDGLWFVSDLGSTNGVKLNTVKIAEESQLREGDLIEFGDQMIRVTGLGAAAPQLVFTTVAEEPVAPAIEIKPAPPPPPVPEEPAAPPTDQIAAFFSAGAEKLFDSKPGRDKKKPAAPGTSPKEGAKKSRRISPLLFYTLIGCIAVIGVSAAMLTMEPAKKPPAAGAKSTAGKTGALSIDYVKSIKTRDNVFRFSLLLENSEVEFTIDDIKSKRHFSRREKISTDLQEGLRERLAASGIWNENSPPPPQGGEGETVLTRSLTLVDGLRIKTYAVQGKYATGGFDEAERIIDDFTETYGLQTISLTPEELKTMAEANFAKAEDYYNNREARSTNLRDAIKRYKLVASALEQFSPRPPMWERAQRQLQEASAEQQRKLAALEVERIRLSQLDDPQGVRNLLLQIIELTDQDSREYQRARDMLFKLDTSMRRRKR